ncbi:MAG: protein kinase [Myxococcales bacterium]|nr:protein kinase [Myxococcales bacterium]
MTTARDRRGPTSSDPGTRATARSGAGWSDRPPAARPVTAPAVDAEPRYVDVELAGVGGMGTVMIAHDRHLGRDVAIKRIAAEPDDHAAGARLAREAAITARLEHPSIVPIYDAGVGPDGRPYYAMRLVRGRSLAERLADTPDLAARLPLVRAFLAVCQAMAYAHRQGVIHRDLKPANVMIGEFGEVHVVDWGLARRLDEPEPEHEALAGTPAYLAPERARGEGSTRASDVWSLGAILGELLCGAALLPASRLEILARLSASEPPPWPWPPRCPGELVAIAHKALAWRVEDRYPDAEVLAADVSAYLDGRRVGAHAYSTTELARRLIYAWRWQVAAVTAGLVAGSVVLALTWSRIAGEQRRAILAERRATAALADTRVALAWALDRGAVAALLAGDVAEAETSAAQALTYGESIDARGVLAATRAAARPLAAQRIHVPGCPRVVPDGATTFLCHGADQLALWRVGEAAPRWQVPSVATSAIALDGRWVIALERGVAATVLDGRDGSIHARVPVAALVDSLARDPGRRRVVLSNQREAILLAPDTDRVRALERPCAGGATIDALAVGRAQVLLACNDGRLVRIADDGAAAVLAEVPLAGQNPASSAALADDERTLAIGGVHGELVLVDLVTGTVSAPRVVLPEPVRRVRLLGELVAVAGERGGLHVWSRSLEAELLRLPERAGGRFELVDGELVSGGADWWRWRLPAVPMARRFEAPAGLAAAAIAPDGSQVVAARGDGRLSMWQTALGRLIAEPVLGPGVVKRADFSPDGREVGVAIAGPPGALVVDAASGAIVSTAPDLPGSHRVAYLRDGTRVVLPYGDRLIRWTPAGERQEVRGALWGDLELSGDRAQLWLLSRSGEVWRADGGPPVRQFEVPGALAIAPFTATPELVVATASQVTLRDHAGRIRLALDGVVDGVFDVAVSPDDRFVVAAVADGTIEVWSAADGRRIAHLRGHAARVAWVGFAAGALWSAGWDGVVLRWDLAALTAPAATLVTDAATAWALPPLGRAAP